MLLRIRYKRIGGHIHCRFFTALAHDTTWANSGTLVFREAEFRELFSHDADAETRVHRGLDFELIHEDLNIGDIK